MLFIFFNDDFDVFGGVIDVDIANGLLENVLFTVNIDQLLDDVLL